MKKVLVFIFLIALSGSYANAGGKLKMSVSEDYKYDSNIYKKTTGRTSSLIRVTRGMVQYDTVLPETTFSLNSGAMFGYNAYNKHSNTNNSIDSLINLGLKNSHFEFAERFLFTSDPATNADDEREKRWKNTFSLSYKTKKAYKLWLKATIADFYDEYVNLNSLDRNAFSLGLRGYYSHSEKTDFYVRYKYTDITYQNKGKSNSGTHSFGAGMSGRISSKLTGDIDVSYFHRNYHTSLSNYRNKVDLLGLEVALTYEQSERTTFKLDASRQMEETVRTSRNRYFIDSGLALTAHHKLSSRSTASLRLSYDYLDYIKADTSSAGKHRHDNLYSIRPSISHKINSILSGNAFVEYKFRKSNINKDYEDFLAGIGMRALF